MRVELHILILYLVGFLGELLVNVCIEELDISYAYVHARLGPWKVYIHNILLTN